MKNADKNRDPIKAHKRATADLRCAARKLTPAQALAVLADVYGADVVYLARKAVA